LSRVEEKNLNPQLLISTRIKVKKSIGYQNENLDQMEQQNYIRR